MRTLGVQTSELKETLDTTVLALEGKRALKFLAEQWRSELERRAPFNHRLERRSQAIARLIAELTAVRLFYLPPHFVRIILLTI